MRSPSSKRKQRDKLVRSSQTHVATAPSSSVDMQERVRRVLYLQLCAFGKKLNRPVLLLAPTGRAAKVFSLHAGLPATTIHKAIYRQQTFKGEDTVFDRGWNNAKEALFIVDESSMIANQGGGNSQFGTGQLP